MRPVLFAILTCAAACTFDDPSYDGTSFTCDAEHPCPDGQSCVSGMCAGTMTVGNGVACGDTTCAPGSSCCSIVSGDPHCIAAGESCNGSTAACDGSEDCADGFHCCTASAATCTEAASCSARVCTDSADCAGAAPDCCFLTLTPWGICSVC